MTQNIEEINDDSPSILAKYKKYYGIYKPDDIFYGLGIENETYITFEKMAEVTGKEIKEKRSRERYSVDYYLNFKNDALKKVYEKIKDTDKFRIPWMLSAYFLNKCDQNGEHMTLYRKNPPPNPKFLGKTVYDLIYEESCFIRNCHHLVFDGDTLEITTQNFYKTTVLDCIDEFVTAKNQVLEEFKRTFQKHGIYRQLGEISFQHYNYGFAKFLTNPNNIMVCNNGTYHINITLPTKLDSEAKIADMATFESMHRNAIRAIQWVEPLMAACYGSPDIFSLYSDAFSKGSLRLALSRYISVGTYDTIRMIPKKLLDDYRYQDNPDCWYNQYHLDSGYNPPKTIGYDFNYNKFRNHGIELRIFDYFPEKYLEEIINVIVLLCQFSLEYDVMDPRNSVYTKIWNQTIYECVRDGNKGKISKEFIEAVESVFQVGISMGNPQHVFQQLASQLYFVHSESNFAQKISPRMKHPTIHDFNGEMYEQNKTLII